MSNEILPCGTRVKASKSGSFDDAIIGIIDDYSPHAGPDNAADNSFYIISEYTALSQAPHIHLTPHVIPDPLYQFEKQKDWISVDQYWNGIPVQAMDFGEPIDGILTGQLLLNDEQVFIVKHFSEGLGMYTKTAFTQVRLVPGQPIPDERQPAKISKSQLYGLLTQLTNLITNGSDTAAAMRSVANLYSKPDEVLAELSALRDIVKNA